MDVGLRSRRASGELTGIETTQVAWDFMKAYAFPLRPELNEFQLESGLLSGSFTGGYPSGEACLMVSSELSPEASWEELAVIALNDLGGGDFEGVSDPRTDSIEKGFYRVETFPKGGL